MNKLLEQSPCLKRRRLTNQLYCRGSCGKKSCNKVFEQLSGLNRHCGKQHCSCPVCCSTFSDRSTYYKHFRNKHPLHMKQYNITHPTKKLPMPSQFRNKCSKNQWQILKKMIRRNICHDKNIFPTSIDWLNQLNTNPKIHQYTTDIMTVIVEQNMLQPNYMDACGGFCPSGLILQSHGGLFALSLDRKNNDLPHFLPNQPALENLNLIPLALNHNTNPVNHHGTQLCQVLRQKCKETHTKEAIIRIEESQEKTRLKRKMTLLYNKCNSIRGRDELCRSSFPTLKKLWEYCKDLLKKQNYQCAISSIPMLVQATTEEEKLYVMSVDAIDPRKGHVKGNLRIVCVFLNSTNLSKQKTYVNPDDHPSSWTQQLFFEYIQLV